jgi:hypothetical protein
MTDRIKKVLGSSLFKAVVACLMCVLVLSGCNEAKKEYENIGTRLEELNTEVNEFAEVADAYYNDGLLTDELYDNITDLRTDITELFGNYNETTNISSERNTVFKDNIATIESKLSQYKDEFGEVVGDIDDVKGFAEELIDNAKSLESSIDDSVKDEYDKLCNELEAIATEGKDDVIVKAKLLEIKQELAVMASKVGADNDTIDKLTQGTVLPNPSNEDSKEKGEQSDEQPVSDTLQELVDSYTSLQNEASRSFDKGDVTEEDYMSLLNVGVKVAELKENPTSDSEELNNSIAELKSELYTIADKMGSALKDKFK